MALARAIDHYGFPKPIALGDNTLAWDLEKEVEPWLNSRPRRTHAPPHQSGLLLSWGTRDAEWLLRTR
ncbi:MAG: hypothetical protein CR217_14440 [Beijerinckiaceae bacterium]|jgi:hypothetical protein|nr:MAG: hypothetical protein CR217_14440 [Beijerinckiaceae bacterium]